jgi:uncharacterized membrane protein YgdD (TMEM256/DUF423 family)
MDRKLIFVGAVFGFLGVALGAFGAHILKARLSPDMLAVFETGVRYHLIHAVAIVASAAVADRVSDRLLAAAGWLFALGIVLFSGSLYALALTGTTTFGAVTPMGGVAFLAGWMCLTISAL